MCTYMLLLNRVVQKFHLELKISGRLIYLWKENYSACERLVELIFNSTKHSSQLRMALRILHKNA